MQASTSSASSTAHSAAPTAPLRIRSHSLLYRASRYAIAPSRHSRQSTGCGAMEEITITDTTTAHSAQDAAALPSA